MDVLSGLPLRTLLLHGLDLGAQGSELAAMAALQYLEIDGEGLDSGVVQALPTLAALTRLSLDWLPGHIGSNANSHSLERKRQRLVHPALQLASVLQMTELQSLTLPAALIAESRAAVLLALPRLRSLELIQADFDAWGPAGLSSLTTLTRLQLNNSCMRAHGAATLAGLPAVLSLNLWGCDLDDAAVQSLRFMTGLQVLCLRGNERMTAASATSVAQMSSLTKLDMVTNAFLGRAGNQALAALTSLRDLDLSRCGDAGLWALGQLTRLTRLQLSIDTAGAGQALASLVALRRLTVFGHGFTMQDGQAVLTLPWLRRLELYGSRTTEEGKRELAAIADERHVCLVW